MSNNPLIREVTLMALDGLRVLRDDANIARMPLAFEIQGEAFWMTEDEARQVADIIYAELGQTPAVSNGNYAESILRLAVEHDKPVTFGYAKGNGDYIENRRLVPGKVEQTKNGYTIVVGHDPDRDDVRAYRVDRIKGQVTLG